MQIYFSSTTVKTRVKRPTSKRPKIGFQGQLSLNAGQKYSGRNILQYFRPSLSYHLSLRSLLCLFLSGLFYTGFSVVSNFLGSSLFFRVKMYILHFSLHSNYSSKHFHYIPIMLPNIFHYIQIWLPNNYYIQIRLPNSLHSNMASNYLEAILEYSVKCKKITTFQYGFQIHHIPIYLPIIWKPYWNLEAILDCSEKSKKKYPFKP